MTAMNSYGWFLVIWGYLFRLLFFSAAINQIEMNMRIFICEWTAPPEISRYQLITCEFLMSQMEIRFSKITVTNSKRMHHVLAIWYMHSVKYYEYHLRRQRLWNANVASVINVARTINFILFSREKYQKNDQTQKRNIFSLKMQRNQEM